MVGQSGRVQKSAKTELLGGPGSVAQRCIPRKASVDVYLFAGLEIGSLDLKDLLLILLGSLLFPPLP